jgi:hypothetical protein
VITRSVVAYLADANPNLALHLRSNHPTALLNLAQDRLNQSAGTKNIDPAAALPREDTSRTVVAKGLASATNNDPMVETDSADDPLAAIDAHTLTQIRSWVEMALLEDPLNARAFRILGTLSHGTTQATLMQAAVRHSFLESVAVFWMMQKSFQDGDYRAAIRYADIMLKTRPSSPETAMGVLGRVAETPGVSAELKQLLASNPRWRADFLRLLPKSISDARTPLDYLLALRDTTTPPTISELSPYLDFLIQNQLYDLAYYTWLQFLPPDQLSKAGHLFNGGFEIEPVGLPFDWTFTSEAGATIEIVERTDGTNAHALFLEFGVGRVDVLRVTQVVMLAPGDYQFQGSYRADIVSQRGMQWRVICAGKSRTVIGESPLVIGAKSDWSDLRFTFSVPKIDCPAQSVELAFTARSASEQFVSGSAWFDDLQIAREATVDP